MDSIPATLQFHLCKLSLNLPDWYLLRNFLHLQLLQYCPLQSNSVFLWLRSNRIINKSKIKRFNNFAVSSVTLIDKILLGNVLYPCDTEKFIPEVREFLYNIQHSGIVVKFNIGELNITPNRENIIYTKDTINKITDRILAAKKELEDLIANKLNKDYDNLYEYWKVIKNNIKYNPLTDDYTSCSSRYANCVGYYTRVIASNLTFKGSKVLSGTDCISI